MTPKPIDPHFLLMLTKGHGFESRSRYQSALWGKVEFRFRADHYIIPVFTNNIPILFFHRQHHCRKCGKAVCDSCSTKKCPLPGKGHEFPVRICENCWINVTEEEKKSLARFYDMKHCVRYMSFDEGRKMMLTVGPDHIIKVWSLKGIV